MCVMIYTIWQVWKVFINRFLILVAKSLSALLYDIYYGGPVPTANKS